MIDLDLYDLGTGASDEQINRWAISRRDVRFALGILADLATPERIADALVGVIEGEYPDTELGDKWIALGSGLCALTGTPIPSVVAFSWGIA